VARLDRLCRQFRTVALGSSGEWATPGSSGWWGRMSEAMNSICPDGRPLARLHGLRMLDPAIFSKLPLASADSTNAAVNCGSLDRFGMYLPPTAAQRAAVGAFVADPAQLLGEFVEVITVTLSRLVVSSTRSSSGTRLSGGVVTSAFKYCTICCTMMKAPLRSWERIFNVAFLRALKRSEFSWCCLGTLMLRKVPPISKGLVGARR
ncbi:MAG: hypothetical protein EOO40_10135, partial [Deltaproteobacteria bacterium]